MNCCVHIGRVIGARAGRAVTREGACRGVVPIIGRSRQWGVAVTPWRGIGIVRAMSTRR